MKVVIDTNVLLSALLFHSHTSHIHILWKDRQIFPVANKAIIHEYALTFTYDKFNLTSDEVASIFDEEIFPYFSIIKSSKKKIPYPPDDADDIPFLHAALDGKVDFLISGDPHLLTLNGKYAFPILNPSDFLKRIC